MATKVWVNIGSDNGLLPDGTWTNAALSLVRSSDIHLQTISQDLPRPPITKITYLKFHSNLPGANKLKKSVAESHDDSVHDDIVCWD